MGILDLIKGIGENNVMLQSIDGSLVKSVDKKRTKDTEITFATNQTNTSKILSGSGKVGIVIWVDRGDYQSVINKK